MFSQEKQHKSELPHGAWFPSALYPVGKMGPPSDPSYQKPSGYVDRLGRSPERKQKPQEQGKNVGLGKAGKGGAGRGMGRLRTRSGLRDGPAAWDSDSGTGGETGG